MIVITIFKATGDVFIDTAKFNLEDYEQKETSFSMQLIAQDKEEAAKLINNYSATRKTRINAITEKLLKDLKEVDHD